MRGRVGCLEQKIAPLAFPQVFNSSELTEQYWKILFKWYRSVKLWVIGKNEPPKISVSAWCSLHIQGSRFVKIKKDPIRIGKLWKTTLMFFCVRSFVVVFSS